MREKTATEHTAVAAAAAVDEDVAAAAVDEDVAAAGDAAEDGLVAAAVVGDINKERRVQNSGSEH